MQPASESTPVRASTTRLSSGSSSSSSKPKSSPATTTTPASKPKAKETDRSEFQAQVQVQVQPRPQRALLDQKSGKGGGECEPPKPEGGGGLWDWISDTVGGLFGGGQSPEPCEPQLPPAVVVPQGPQAPAQPQAPAPGAVAPPQGGSSHAASAQRAVTEAYAEAGLHRPNVQDPNDGGRRYQAALAALNGGKSYDDVKASLLSELYSDPSVRALPANQAPQKKNQIAVYDAYAHVLNRAPDAAGRQTWLNPNGSEAQALAGIRARGGTDEDVANYVSGALLASPERQDQIPLISQITPAGIEDANAWEGDSYYCGPTSAAMIARAVGYRSDIPRSQDDDLIQHLADTFPEGGALKISDLDQTPVGTMTEMLEGVTGSPPGVHGMPGTDADSVAEMKAALREGRILVANGNFPGASGHYVVVSGFDKEGNFIVKDPYHWLPEKCPPDQLTGFLRLGNATWWDAAGPTAPVAGGGSPVSTTPPASTPPGSPAAPASGGSYSGVLPGAVYNTTPSHIPPGEHTILGRQSLDAQQIDGILRAAGSPAAGSGEAFVKWGQKYNIDPAYALAFFAMESSYGTNPSWVGNFGNGQYSNSIGNIRYYGEPSPTRDPQYHDGNGYRAYDSWDAGIHDWFELLTSDPNYNGLHTVEQIVPVYAPNTENDTANYVATVNALVDGWRRQYGT